MAKFKVSRSKVKLYQQCRFAYHCKFVEGLRKRIKSRPLEFGSIIHEMLEASANGDDPFKLLNNISLKNKKLFAAEREMYGDLIEDIRVIMREYYSYWPKSDWHYIQRDGKRAEHELEVELPGTSLLLTLKIDAFVRTEDSSRWLLENKTFTKLPSVDDRWRDLQTSVYLKACEFLGMKPFTGVFWNYVRSKPPTRPQILKDGTLSARQIDTLPLMVKKVIKENHLSEKDYKGVLRDAELNRESYFYRISTPINKKVVEMIFNDFVDIAKEVKVNHGKRRERTISRHCGWCDYEMLCRAELTGSDTDFLKEREYDRKEETGEDERKNDETGS